MGFFHECGLSYKILICIASLRVIDLKILNPFAFDFFFLIDAIIIKVVLQSLFYEHPK